MMGKTIAWKKMHKMALFLIKKMATVAILTQQFLKARNNSNKSHSPRNVSQRHWENAIEIRRLFLLPSEAHRLYKYLRIIYSER